MTLDEAVTEATTALHPAALKGEQEVTISSLALWTLVDALHPPKKPSFFQRWLHNN